MNNQYYFISQWIVKGTCKEVYDIISDSDSLSNWWPSVYLDVKTTCHGNENSIGKKVSLHTKGFLPYTLKWQFEVLENTKDSMLVLRAFGDFEGRGIWEFEKQGGYCLVTFDWKLEAKKPLLTSLSFLLRPLFKANHIWAMKKGEKSLQLELLRRRIKDSDRAGVIPPPPKPAFPHNLLKNKIFTSLQQLASVFVAIHLN